MTRAQRPSRRPLRGLLRMTDFINTIINLRHPEEARSAVSKDAYFGMLQGDLSARRLARRAAEQMDMLPAGFLEHPQGAQFKFGIGAAHP